ncbi:MAG: ABC-2 family transporter protein [Eubacterium sp.]|nr:ABC-2 family transporter protein [Eubacterium sp.]
MYTSTDNSSADIRTKALTSIIISNIIFSIMECNIVNQINDKIRSGEIAMDLLKPMNYMAYLFSTYVGENIINLIFRTVPLVIVSSIFWKQHIASLHYYCFFLISILFSFFINFLYSYIIGLIAFWLLVTWPLNMMLNSIYKFFSGIWIPVFLMPKTLNSISNILPFKYIYSAPISILLAEKQVDVMTQLLLQLTWCIGLSIFSVCIWNYAKRKLVIQGG